MLGTLLVHMVGARIYPRPTFTGKLAMFFQVLTVLTGLLSRSVPPGLATVVVYLAALFTIVSGLQYIVQGLRFLNSAHAAESDEHEPVLRR
jgi:phosphatidylglycerophosphate synthase